MRHAEEEYGSIMSPPSIVVNIPGVVKTLSVSSSSTKNKDDLEKVELKPIITTTEKTNKIENKNYKSRNNRINQTT